MPYQPGVRRFFAARKAAPLPYDSEVEYLEGTGTQWIDTGLPGGYDVGTTIDFALTSSQQEKGIFGCLGFPRQCLILAADYFRYDLADMSTYRYRQSNTRRTVSYNQYTHEFVDSVSGPQGWDDVPGSFDETPDTMTIFVDKRDGAIVSASRIVSMRLYGFSMTDANGNDMIRLIPVRVGTVGCVYDYVSGTLFGNAGTGAFGYGNDI